MEKTVKKTEKKEINKEEPIKLKGRYISTIGKRKTAIARIRMYKKGSGVLVVNEDNISNYFQSKEQIIIKQPLKLTGLLRDLNFSIVVRGSSKKSQAEAVRHGIVRALIELNSELKPSLKAKGWTTRDARIKERKKPGLKKARRAPQWSKR
ncbi:30S ribosomal protein S9 [Candidatus Falkowbacteria bacterium]|nr:MAG: 30S ribosomal protein S9 [Candidatus Falkowbacteria bacterium]